MKSRLLHLIIKIGFVTAIFILNHLPMDGQGDTLISFWQGYHTPNIISPNFTVSNLTEGPGITAYSCSGPYVYASGFDQGHDIDALNNGDYWEFSMTPNNGYQLEVNYYEVQQRASHHPNSEMNTLGSLYWKIGSGGWIKSNITAGVQRESTLSWFCSNTSSRRPHQNTDFVTTETVTFRIVRWIYDNDNQMHPARITRNGYQWVSGFVTQLPLPVEFTNFEAIKKDQNVLLQWETASETNNRGFEIERSSNGRTWDIIDFVEGRGTTTELNHYTFLDTQPMHGDNYYRLKQVDDDGHFEYSKVISIPYDIERLDIQVHPNPSKGNFQVQIPNLEKQKMKIRLTDKWGRVIWRSQLIENESIWRKDFHLPQNGLYFISAQVGEQVFHEKILVLEEG